MSVLPSVLIPAERIHQRLDELAEEISRDYAERDLVLVGLLRASFIFLADLAADWTFRSGSTFSPRPVGSPTSSITATAPRPRVRSPWALGWHGLDAEGGLSVGAVAVKHGQPLRVSPWHPAMRCWIPVEP